MTAFGHVLFNLLANSVFSFAGALAIVYATLGSARIGQNRCRLWLLLLPFVKVALDLVTGVPESSFLWVKAAGHVQDLGTFRVGFGVERFLPIVHLSLGAFSGGVIYPQSFGDVLDSAISKRVGAWGPSVVAAVCAAVGVTRLGLRFVRGRRFARAVLAHAHAVESRAMGARAIDVLVSERYEGVPFAIGVRRPRVVFSARTYAAFSSGEREAVLQHELAHIAHFDLMLLAVLSVFADFFWFLPGLQGAIVRIQSVLEHRADDAAVLSGAPRGALASALVRAGEVLSAPVAGAAIVSSQSLLVRRVHRLLEATAAPRTRLITLANVARAGLAAVITLVIVQALFLGNHAAAFVRFTHP